MLVRGVFIKKKAVDARDQILTQTSLKHLGSNLQVFEEHIDKMNWEEGFITREESIKNISKK